MTYKSEMSFDHESSYLALIKIGARAKKQFQNHNLIGISIYKTTHIRYISNAEKKHMET